MASFHELSPRLQMATFVLVAGLAVGAGWQVLLAPELNDLAARDTQLASLKAELEKATAVAQQLPHLTREIAALEKSLDQTTAVLPDEKDAQDVLRQLHTLASDAALNLSSFTPKPVVARSQYVEWPIEIGLQGGYHDLGRFFDRIAGLPLLISVSGLHLTAAPAPAGKGSVNASCVATTYVFSREAVSAPAPVAAGAVAPTGGKKQ